MNRAIDPLREAKNDLEIFQQLADRFGFGENFNPRAEEEWFEHILKSVKEEDRRKLRDEGALFFTTAAGHALLWINHDDPLQRFSLQPQKGGNPNREQSEEPVG